MEIACMAARSAALMPAFAHEDRDEAWAVDSPLVLAPISAGARTRAHGGGTCVAVAVGMLANARLLRSFEASSRSSWDDATLFRELMAEHGGVRLSAEKRAALLQIFSLVYHGEVFAMEVSAQLVPMIAELDVRKVLAAQVFEEAKHVAVLGRYLQALGAELPAPNRFGLHVLEAIKATDHACLKLLGMQLFVENMAHHLFRQLEAKVDEPVLRGVLRQIDKDEVKHVGLARSYLPRALATAGPFESWWLLGRLTAWSVSIMAAAYQLKPAAAVLGIDMVRATESCARDHRNLLIGLGSRRWSALATTLLSEEIVGWFAGLLYERA